MDKLRITELLRAKRPDLVYYLPKFDEGERTQTYNKSISNDSIEELVNKSITDFIGSKEREMLLKSKDYYSGKTDILDKKRYNFCGIEGTPNDKLSNEKINRNFLRKLIRQKNNYSFSKPFSIATEKETYANVLEDIYFTKGFYTKIMNLGKESMLGAIAWLHPYYDGDGILKFELIPNEQVIPLWSDTEHRTLQNLIHFYTIMEYEGDEEIRREYADYYLNSGVIRLEKGLKDGIYRITSENMLPDGTIRPKGNFISERELKEIITNERGEQEEKVIEDETGEPIKEKIDSVFGRIPWVAFKYNSDEVPLLNFIKTSIDAYEKLISRFIDTIIDDPESIKIVKGYDGTDLGEFVKNISEYRAVLVDGDGDMSSLTTNINTVPTIEALTNLRRGIYEDGSGVDMQAEELGDKSGVTLKFLYSDLDLDCNEIINEFSNALEELMFFIDADLYIKTGVDYSEEEVTFKFNTSSIINISETITDINNSASLLPTRTLLEQHPYVTDVEQVLKDLEKEEEESLLKQQELFGEQTQTNAEEVEEDE